jgi:hypothetical protein
LLGFQRRALQFGQYPPLAEIALAKPAKSARAFGAAAEPFQAFGLTFDRLLADETAAPVETQEAARGAERIARVLDRLFQLEAAHNNDRACSIS